MATGLTAPRYAHDCDSCRYLGQIDKYDLYYCTQSDGGTVLARYADEPSHYASRGFMLREIEKIRAEIGGLEGDEPIILAAFRTLPSLILNIWKRPAASTQ